MDEVGSASHAYSEQTIGQGVPFYLCEEYVLLYN
jgi:hypothetical protein